MADIGECFPGEIEKFNQCSSRIARLVYKDTPEFRKYLLETIDELNSVEYSLKIFKEEVVGLLLAQCCHLVPLSDELLIVKFSQLVVNTVSRQQLILREKLHTVVEYFLAALRQCQPWTYPDLLRALSALLYENSGQLPQFHNALLAEKGVLLGLVHSTEDEVCRGALQCVENLTARSSPDVYLSDEHQAVCFDLFQATLHSPKPQSMDDVCHCRVLLCGLRGLQNLLLATKSCPQTQLGPMLAAIKVYMLHGLPGHPAQVPTRLYPTPMSQYEPQPDLPEERKPSAEVSLRPALTKSSSSPHGKKTRKKKAKTRVRERGDTSEGGASTASQLEHLHLSGTESSPAADATSLISPSSTPRRGDNTNALLPPWATTTSSESEYSDTEGGQASKLRSYLARVRQCALNCFHALIKVTSKRDMFGYWSSFLPDGSGGRGGPPQGQSLFTSIMKDPSSKARAGSLAVMTALLEGSKRYLMAAEDSEPKQQAFTAFSSTLGHLVKELHRCLLLALVSENSPLALTQVIKCLGTLVANVTYQRLRPGLLTRVVRQVKQFLAHRDPNIRVACLTCLGSVVSATPPLMEVWQLLQASPRLGNQRTLSQGSQGSTLDTQAESGYHSSGLTSSGGVSPAVTPGSTTPSLPSGCITPPGGDGMTGASWLVRLCLQNVANELVDDAATERNLQPLPVRLESLQLLAHITKGYFPALRPCLPLVCELIQCCLHDKDASVQLHGAKLLEEVAFMLLQQQQPQPESPPPMPSHAPLSTEQAVEFWLPLLQAPLPLVLQRQTNHAVRATACDCLADIGPQTFKELPVDKRMLCVTLLLGLSGDEDSHVRAAAVRALGVYVLYPCLREDVSFVADVANAIITALQESNVGVKVKAAWSLGNLSDALVMNKSAKDQDFLDDLSDMLLLKLFECSIRSAQDNDKVKSNAVRALGNFLRYLPGRSYGNSRFSLVVDQGIQALMKNIRTGTMKVRWNACYATSNMFKNDLLPLGTAPWTEALLLSLATVVQDCKNFKVRINAAVALAVPAKRGCYGDTSLYVRVWESLMKGLQNISEAVTDFADYKYRESLSEQVSVAVLHLLCLVAADDLVPLHAATQAIASSLATQLGLACQRASPPQGVQQLSTARGQLELLTGETLSNQQQAALSELQDMLAAVDSESGTSSGTLHTSAFRDTYD